MRNWASPLGSLDAAGGSTSLVRMTTTTTPHRPFASIAQVAMTLFVYSLALAAVDSVPGPWWLGDVVFRGVVSVVMGAAAMRWHLQGITAALAAERAER